MSVGTFCTIVTGDWVPNALALYRSLCRRDETTALSLLIAEDVYDTSWITDPFPDIEVFLAPEICGEGVGGTIYRRYFRELRDEFRWSMKGVFIDFLLTQRGFERILYLDPDMHCCGEFDFLFEKLATSSVILAPHWRPFEPPEWDETGRLNRDELYCKWYLANFSDGFFNAGLIGASREGAEAMRWWAKACAYRCERDPEAGFYDDQRYLDLVATRFAGVETLEHQGCDIAAWNSLTCKRTPGPDGSVLINDRWPLVFVHFTPRTIVQTDRGLDPLLRPFLEECRVLVADFAETLGVASSMGVPEAEEAPSAASGG